MLSRVRLTLVQSVLKTIPVYTMQATLLPVAICNSIDRISRNFLLGGNESNSHGHLSSSDKVCKPTDYGKLGLRITRDANIALLSRIGWNLETNKNSIVCFILQSIYLHRDNFETTIAKSSVSAPWQDIL